MPGPFDGFRLRDLVPNSPTTKNSLLVGGVPTSVVVPGSVTEIGARSTGRQVAWEIGRHPIQQAMVALEALKANSTPHAEKTPSDSTARQIGFAAAPAEKVPGTPGLRSPVAIAEKTPGSSAREQRFRPPEGLDQSKASSRQGA
ncbi:MAG TPA: hypothetical protein VGX00_08550 [Thermoplasmata archaeon]|nr:hypothetical protein [Thermoplasmata archaeon]